MTATNNNRPLSYTQLNDDPKPRQFVWFRKLLFIAVAAVAIAIVLKALTPTQVEEQEILQKNFNDTISRYDNVTYTGDVVLIPKKLPVLKTEQVTIDSENIKTSLINKFGLTAEPAPETDSTYLQMYSNKNFSLYQLPETGNYQLASKNQPPTGVVDVQKALVSAQEVVDFLYPNAKLEAMTQNIIYGSSEGGEVESTNPSKANITIIPFASQAVDYAVFSGQSINPVVTVWINSENELQKLTASTEYLSISTQRYYETISYTQALRNINDNNASIVSGIYLNPGQISYDSITEGTFTSAQVEYHTDPTTGEAVPYYHFSGELTDSQNKTFTADVITPAIQTKFSN